MDACAFVEDQVRRTVRDSGVDPLANPDAVRALVDDAVAAFVAACADGTAPLGLGSDFRADIPDTSELARDVLDVIVGFGPLQRYLDDPSVEELWINEPGRVFVARNGRSELTPIVLDSQEVCDLVERMLSSSRERSKQTCVDYAV